MNVICCTTIHDAPGNDIYFSQAVLQCLTFRRTNPLIPFAIFDFSVTAHPLARKWQRILKFGYRNTESNWVKLLNTERYGDAWVVYTSLRNETLRQLYQEGQRDIWIDTDCDLLWLRPIPRDVLAQTLRTAAVFGGGNVDGKKYICDALSVYNMGHKDIGRVLYLIEAVQKSFYLLDGESWQYLKTFSSRDQDAPFVENMIEIVLGLLGKTHESITPYQPLLNRVFCHYPRHETDAYKSKLADGLCNSRLLRTINPHIIREFERDFGSIRSVIMERKET